MVYANFTVSIFLASSYLFKRYLILWTPWLCRCQRGISSNGYKSTVLSNVLEEKGQTSGGFHICSAKTYESIPIQPSCLPFKYNGYTQFLDNPIWITTVKIRSFYKGAPWIDAWFCLKQDPNSKLGRGEIRTQHGIPPQKNNIVMVL